MSDHDTFPVVFPVEKSLNCQIEEPSKGGCLAWPMDHELIFQLQKTLGQRYILGEQIYGGTWKKSIHIHLTPNRFIVSIRLKGANKDVSHTNTYFERTCE